MVTLTSSYQYLGRSSVMTSQDGTLSYYLLLYGKTSPDNTTGIHKVSIKTVLASINTGATFYLYTTAYNGKIDNSYVFTGTNKPKNAWEMGAFTEGGVTYKTGTLIGEGSVDVDCTNGLARDITVSGYWKFNHSGDTYTPAKNTERTVSTSVTLSAIPRRAELITAPNFSDGDNPTVTYSNPAGTAVDSVQVGIYDNSGYTAYVAYRDVSKTGTSYTFNLTDAERNALIKAVTQGNSVAVKFYIRTTINGKVNLAQPLTRTFSISGANPIVTGSIYCDDATYALTGSRTKLIRYISSVTASMTVTAQKGAAIYENLCLIHNGSKMGGGRSVVFNYVESDEFVFSAEDDRGNIGTDVVTASMIDYIKLTCTIGSNRPDALGNMTVTCVGDYFNASFGSQSNTLKVQYRYKVAGGTFGEWTNMTATTPGNRYSAYANFVIPDFDQSAAYAFETRAIDKLTTITSSADQIKSKPVFHWGENDFVFEVPVTFNAGSDMSVDDLTVTGDLRLKSPNSSFGNTIYFGDSNYVSIGEPYDDRLVIKGSIVDLQGTIKHNGVELPTLQYGYWTPTLDYSAISSYTTQYGWYQKIGQNVTVGFYVKAVCESNFDDVNIEIGGLPFYPMAQATGGGMCSGAYISGGFNFQCYVAETSGKITTRVQACNNTSATNLSTSASGCNYRFDGGVITLSGTISYMAST